ncbi:MAG: hypothetical protein ACLQIB_29010 [Isosphaeraceae bacterium]
MLVQRLHPIPRKIMRRNALRVESDPAHLSVQLRELALATHQAFRSKGDARSGDGGGSLGPVFDAPSRDDWIDLHSQIVQLERALDAQHLDLLVSYVAALRQKVETCLV